MEYGHYLHLFGPFCLDTNEQVLLRAGRRVPLPAKAVRTLMILVRNSGHIVQKDDLMKEVWPNEFVEEGNLAQHIFLLRRAFGETVDHPQYIETVPRRGYRFLGSVKESQDTSVSTEVALLSPPTHSLAVLPFVNGSLDPKIEYISDSITENIINDLAQLAQIRVRPRSTVFRYKNKDLDAQHVGRKLAVHSVLLGTVQAVDNTLIIGTELVDVGGGWQVYGKTYKAKFSSVWRVHEQIAKDITVVLGLKPIEG